MADYAIGPPTRRLLRGSAASKADLLLGAGASWLLTAEELMGQVDTTTGAGPTFERIWYDAVRQARRAVWLL